MIVAYEQRRPREDRRYASLPAWVFWVNAPSIVIGWTLLGLTMSAQDCGVFFLFIADLLAFVAHFLLVFLPTINRVLFAERIAPVERLIVFAMACAGPTGVFLALYFWP